MQMIMRGYMPVMDTPIWGYRFTIRGDFNGDGKADTFYEHFYSKKEHRETNKYFSGDEDIYELGDIADEKEVDAYMACNGCGVDTLHSGGCIGPLFIKNEGDLDGDGADEVGYVPSIAQMSSINRYHILSYKHGEWMDICRFEIREWQLPPTPFGGRQYGLFGSCGNYMIDPDDTINAALEKNLQTYSEMVKKLKNGKISVSTFDEVTEPVSVVVDLKHLPRKGGIDVPTPPQRDY